VRALTNRERRSRREDWIAGPLAPNRNTGPLAGKYGTVHSNLSVLPTYPKDEQKGPKGRGHDVLGSENDEGKGWEGYGNEGNLVEGDRVCIVRGREDLRGRIGTIKTLTPERKEVTVERLNTV
jgi:large subunit ribosomal protein L24